MKEVRVTVENYKLGATIRVIDSSSSHHNKIGVITELHSTPSAVYIMAGTERIGIYMKSLVFYTEPIQFLFEQLDNMERQYDSQGSYT